MSKLDKVFTCSSLNTDFRPVKIKNKFQKPSLVIKPDKYTIYQISKDDIQELKYIPEHDEVGFSYLVSPRSTETYTPKWHYTDKWYVVLKTGKRIYLTEKQYLTMKKWFEGEE